MLVRSKSDANWRLLVQFDTSLIPPGAIVKKAILILTYNSIVEQDAVNRNYTAYELSKSWNENEVTWNNATKGKAWDNAGGDFGDL
jgi:hypothetical protein